jgi:hypothetical protein
MLIVFRVNAVQEIGAYKKARVFLLSGKGFSLCDSFWQSRLAEQVRRSVTNRVVNNNRDYFNGTDSSYDRICRIAHVRRSILRKHFFAFFAVLFRTSIG